jgi:hypothetical protein
MDLNNVTKAIPSNPISVMQVPILTIALKGNYPMQLAIMEHYCFQTLHLRTDETPHLDATAHHSLNTMGPQNQNS